MSVVLPRHVESRRVVGGIVEAAGLLAVAARLPLLRLLFLLALVLLPGPGALLVALQRVVDRGDWWVVHIWGPVDAAVFGWRCFATASLAASFHSGDEKP